MALGGASCWLLLAIINLPKEKLFCNHRSAVNDEDFVTQEINKLLLSGALVEVQAAKLSVCSPLGVFRNSAGKLRLIVDLRYVNEHLRSCKG